MVRVAPWWGFPGSCGSSGRTFQQTKSSEEGNGENPAREILQRTRRSAYPAEMAGITLDTIRTLATIGSVGFLIIALVAGILLKSLAQKAAFLAIFGLLALLVWTQRQSLEDCAAVVQASLLTDGAEATCTFLGFSVSVPGLN